MRPVGLRAILCRRLTQLPALKGLRAGSDRVSPAIGTKSCSNRLNGGGTGQIKKNKTKTTSPNPFPINKGFSLSPWEAVRRAHGTGRDRAADARAG